MAAERICLLGACCGVFVRKIKKLNIQIGIVKKESDKSVKILTFCEVLDKTETC